MEHVTATLTEEEVGGLLDIIEVCRTNSEMILERQAEILQSIPAEFHPPGDPAERLTESLDRLERAARSNDLSSYFNDQREQAGMMAEGGLAFDVVANAIANAIRPLAGAVDARFVEDPARWLRAKDSLHRLETETLRVMGGAYATVREDQVGDAYRSTIRRLSTPVIQVWDEVLILPLIGVLDTSRAQQMMEGLLEEIVSHRARMVIIDITGVPTVDTEVARHLISTTRAARMVGAGALLVGISPEVAQTLVRLGVTLGDVETYTDLRTGLERAFDVLGFRVTRQVAAS